MLQMFVSKKKKKRWKKSRNCCQNVEKNGEVTGIDGVTGEVLKYGLPMECIICLVLQRLH